MQQKLIAPMERDKQSAIEKLLMCLIPVMGKNKRGNSNMMSGLRGILAAVIFFGLIGIVGAIFGLIQSDVDDELTENTTAWNNSQDAQSAQGKIFSKLGLVGTVIIFTFILILILGVVGYFMAGNYMGGNYG